MQRVDPLLGQQILNARGYATRLVQQLGKHVPSEFSMRLVDKNISVRESVKIRPESVKLRICAVRSRCQGRAGEDTAG
jgi:hypothetical protein